MSWAKMVGRSVGTGWAVKSRKEQKAGDTGGCFSICFLVEKDGRAAFMKAFDIAGILQQTAADPERMQCALESINFETKLLGICSDAGVKSVLVPIEQGEFTDIEVNQGYPVRYLIFELAELDVRRYHTYRPGIDFLANLMILHHAAKGLFELHSLEIAHQDFKPSNVLIFSDRSSRVADLGRSSHRTSHVWHDKLQFAGDPTYAPIEVVYGVEIPDWHGRRTAGDLYMLGSFAVFLFTSVNITAQVFANLQPQFHPVNWTDPYDQVVPYIRSSMRQILSQHNCFSSKTGREMLGVIRELCDPDPTRRGSPKIGNIPSRYSLRRYVSIFERMVIEVRWRGMG